MANKKSVLKKDKQGFLRPPWRQYDIEDTYEPDLFRELFPYDELPRLVFDHVEVPMCLPDEIWITCTTFRDGQQARPPYTVKQIVDLFTLLHRLGGQKGIIRQTEFFMYSQKDQEAVRKCQELNVPYPEITGWVRAHPSDIKLVKDMGIKEVGILTSISDYHIFLKLGLNRRKAIDQYLDFVKMVLDMGVRPRCHLEDITRADFYGVVVPFAQKLVELSEEYGIDVKLRLCDTLGYGVPYPDAALPRSVPKLVWGMLHEVGVKPEQLEWHGHNDFYYVHANAVCAWMYGCAAANGTLLGYGERTGNPPIEALAIEYAQIRGTTDGMDTTVITEIAEYYEKVVGETIPANKPLVGKEFNVTRAGIHADGVLKNEEIYSIFDTTKILNRAPGIIITDKSGTAGIAFWVNHYFNLTGDKAVDKKHPAVQQIYQDIMTSYENGRGTAFSSEELVELVKKYLPNLLKKKR